MERYYSTTLKASGFPACHFVMDRTLMTAVGIVHKSPGGAKKEAKRLNDEQSTQPWLPFFRERRTLTSPSIAREPHVVRYYEGIAA